MKLLRKNLKQKPKIKYKKNKKGLPHSMASVPLTSQRRLSFKIAQTLSTVAALLFL
jgi:hypothetical protein